MILKNTQLEEKLTTTTKELEHCKALLQGFMGEKENLDKSNTIQCTPQNSRGSKTTDAPRKSMKHVSFADEFPRSSLGGNVDEKVDRSMQGKHSILKTTPKAEDYASPQHNLPKATKEKKILSRDGSIEKLDSNDDQPGMELILKI